MSQNSWISYFFAFAKIDIGAQPSVEVLEIKPASKP
jgi:hypothetical protein